MKAHLTYPASAAQAYWPFQAGSRYSNRRHLTVRLRDLWNTLKAQLGASSEPHIWKTQNDDGRTVWNAYDPISGRLLREAYESEVRIWLEERDFF